MPDDPQPTEPGSQGSIRGYDDAGHMLLAWGSGRGLHLIPGTDEYHVVETDAELEESFKHLNVEQEKVEEDGEAECPRCGCLFDVYRGGISRRVTVCNIAVYSTCSTQEAIEDFVMNSEAY